MDLSGTEGNLRPLSDAPTTPSVLTVAEVASLLRVTTKTIYALAKRGDLPAFRVGRAVRFRHEDVQGYISSRPVKPQEGTR